MYRSPSLLAFMYQLELRLPDAQTRSVDLPLSGGHVGSDPACDIHVDDQRIPRHWLDVRVTDDDLVVTCLDGSSATPLTVPIGHWCVLAAAHVRVVPSARTTYQTAVLERRLDRVFEPADAPGWADPYLELVGEDATTRFPMVVGQFVSIGRKQSECDVALSDPSDRVSRRHASIQWHDGKPVLRDHSTNGTFWRRPSESDDFTGVGRGQPLDNGDLIRIGPWTLRFCWPRAALANEIADTPSPRPVTRRGPSHRTGRINWTFLLASTLAVLCFGGILWLLSR